MREKVRDKERLQHILDAINDIITNKDAFSLAEAKSNPIIYYGFVKEVEIIGEAVYMLTKEYRQSHPEVEWNVIEHMRHVLVHGYYTIDPEQLWDTLQNDIRWLQQRIYSLLLRYNTSYSIFKFI